MSSFKVCAISCFRFLDVEYNRVDEDDDTNKDIEILLVVNDNNPNATTPDFELFDSLYISLKVTDWNTDPEFMDNQNTSGKFYHTSSTIPSSRNVIQPQCR